MNGVAGAARRFREPVTIARVVVRPEEDGPAIVAEIVRRAAADRDDDGVHFCRIPHGLVMQLAVVLVMA